MEKAENNVCSVVISSVIGDRADQQDSYGYLLDDYEGMIVVCDGMGGHEGGQQASQCTVKCFENAYRDYIKSNTQTECMVELAKIADAKVCSLQNSSGNAMHAGSTLVAVTICNDELRWCSVGDSRAYLLREEEFVQLTQDHNYFTVLNEKKRAGLINAEDYANESARGEALVSYVGIGNLSLIDYCKYPIELQKDDKVILMSDGLYKLVSDEELARLMNNFNSIEDTLHAIELKAQKNAKNSGASRDNMTVALIKIK